MSETAFSHFFKKQTQRSFTEYLIDIRIGYAAKLIIDSEKNIETTVNGFFGNMLALPNTVLLSQQNELLSFDLTCKIIESQKSNYSICADGLDQYWVGRNHEINCYKKDHGEQSISCHVR